MSEYVPYRQEYDHTVRCAIESGRYNEPEIGQELSALGIVVVKAPGAEGHCQSWAFESLGIPR